MCCIGISIDIIIGKGISIIISNIRTVSVTVSYYLQPPVIIISTPTQTLCKKPGIGAAQHHKKNLERASWVIVKTNKIKRTRLITMRSKPDYVEADLLLLLLMLLLWFLLL